MRRTAPLALVCLALAGIASGPCRPAPVPLERHVVQLDADEMAGLPARVEALGGRTVQAEGLVCHAPSTAAGNEEREVRMRTEIFGWW